MEIEYDEHEPARECTSSPLKKPVGGSMDATNLAWALSDRGLFNILMGAARDQSPVNVEKERPKDTARWAADTAS